MTVSVTHPPVAGPNDPTKQVSKNVYELPHVVSGLATVAESGAYADLTGLPTLGTAAAANVGDFDAAGDAAAAVAAHVAAGDPHTQYLKESDAGVVIGGTNGSVLFIGGGVVAQDNANFKWGTTAGQGLTLGAGTATTAVSPLAITQTWNNGAITFPGITYSVTDTASANGSKAFQLFGGAAGTTSILSMSNKPDCRLTIGHNAASARLYLNGGVSDSYIVWQEAGATVVTQHLQKPASTMYMAFGDGVSNDHATISPQGFTTFSTGVLGWAASNNAATVNDTGLSRISAGVAGLGTGTAASFAGSLKLTDLIAVGKLSLNGTFGTSGQVPVSGGPSAVVAWGSVAAGDFDSVLTGASTIAANKVRTIGGPLSINDGGGVLTIEDGGRLVLV